ncbi:MAG: molybdopterin molybdenumtransferase MoeA [Xanthomonadales bacterium]|nr:molybdopterin molybdotransferase MoeA [Xanthomonadales bacterium]NIX12570.1 molybdopterin molybdenumtransferase MoeA [Xanthomonadales bacterium]
MISVSQAIAEIRRDSRVLAEVVRTDLHHGLGRVLAGDIVAPINVPPGDNSAMDGFAFRHDDWAGPDRDLPVSRRIAAGSAPGSLEPGTAARIFTGAEIPAGADTVVMQEHCDYDDSRVAIRERPRRGANIRPKAQDIAIGQTVLRSGRRLDPQALGLIASLGIDAFEVFRPLKVAILSNGSELVEPGGKTGPGQIFNSNRYMLEGLVRNWGFEPLDYGIAPDEPDAIRDLLGGAASEADVIISSGGVSVGEEDHIRNVVASMGGIDLWKVSIKPGKPFAFGHVNGTPFIGLPGNPSSVLVTCLVVARPFLFDCQGRESADILPVTRKALFEHRGSSREEYLRARITGDGVECFPRQSSGILLSTVWGDGLVVQRPGQDIRKGDDVEFIPYAVLN